MYEQRGHRLPLYDGNQKIVTTRAIVERVPRWNKSQPAAAARLPHVADSGLTEDGGFIRNLIVTVPAESVVRSIAPILHRIGPSTTICLIQDGLGIMEAVNAACFPRYEDQPLYVFGHMTHALDRPPLDPFGVREVRPGKLYLSALGHDYVESDLTYFPPIQRNCGISHFLNVMSTTPRLQAGGYPLQKFMEVKLHDTIIQSVIEPLTVVLDCTYGGLLTNTYGTQMIDQLLGEILNVVSQLPELKDSTGMKWMVRYGEMRRAVYKKLKKLENTGSRMQSQTSQGIATDIEYLNGYFVERGRELGLKCPVNESVMWMVKAKHSQSLRAKRAEIPWEGYV